MRRTMAGTVDSLPLHVLSVFWLRVKLGLRVIRGTRASRGFRQLRNSRRGATQGQSDREADMGRRAGDYTSVGTKKAEGEQGPNCNTATWGWDVVIGEDGVGRTLQTRGIC